MNISRLAKAYFRLLDERIGPFDRPIQFRPFPFDAGGSLNFLTVGAASKKFVTYVSWDLFGHEQQKRGALGRYELAADCDDERWCVEVLTSIGRQTLVELFEAGDTLDVGPWVEPDAPIQGVIFEEMLRARLRAGLRRESCGLLRCIGVTKEELDFARNQSVAALMDRLRQAGVYPRTEVKRTTIPL